MFDFGLYRRLWRKCSTGPSLLAYVRSQNIINWFKDWIEYVHAEHESCLIIPIEHGQSCKIHYQVILSCNNGYNFRIPKRCMKGVL